ncbi:20S proteasome subunit beta type-1 [Encephalitozoon intestinalis ATCC 50506]|uniref:20S proteasome subunit beta type-1 n=1 Tax=Encephalitozoon intestinalis (strain ATCC 50506) TaxID=876142 RepID=E0S865_ENCIT|nr:20S proteasome subunit beta type-1 [Encephalitozoon intestinalis ATCC 50506]ADM11900.1 20S proteasome subunit beta type-1 [Encephalitozoon intestinalis ATCC 50506]UTX45656.1 proteasome subunit beta type-6 [Encephalitozoon intestinalis]
MLNNKGRIHSMSGGFNLRAPREYGLFEDIDFPMSLDSMDELDTRSSIGAMNGTELRKDGIESLFISKKNDYKEVKEEEKFNPYEDNSGTTVCLKQDDFIIVAGDTRHSSDMVINSREMSKIFRMGNFLLTGTGFYADTYEVYRKMTDEILQYEVDGPMSIHSSANLLSKILYSRRFFPYYSFCTLSGFEKGKAYLYQYDPLGSYDLTTCVCKGSGRSMIQPLLDSFIDKKNWNNASDAQISQEDCIRLVVKAFNSVAERDIKTKDNLEIYVVREHELTHQILPLRRD